MTEGLSAGLKAEPGFASAPLPLSDDLVRKVPVGPAEPLPSEDDSIRCICGYTEDDGATVFCEDCKTWQHIDCYYFPTNEVPEVHQCVICKPRPVDGLAAAQRQSQSRSAAPLTGEKKPKKTAVKATKRRNKESVHLNGVDRFTQHDRASPGPHEPPPSKRPKTSHRTSSSTTS